MPRVERKTRAVTLERFLEIKAPEWGLRVRRDDSFRLCRTRESRDRSCKIYVGLPTLLFCFHHEVAELLGCGDELLVLDGEWHAELFALLTEFEKLTGRVATLVYVKDPLEVNEACE